MPALNQAMRPIRSSSFMLVRTPPANRNAKIPRGVTTQGEKLQAVHQDSGFTEDAVARHRLSRLSVTQGVGSARTKVPRELASIRFPPSSASSPSAYFTNAGLGSWFEQVCPRRVRLGCLRRSDSERHCIRPHLAPCRGSRPTIATGCHAGRRQ
jgi:hypothetical protein